MKNKYDAIIIGAGIGGLTCGCYLAKAGLKVLIMEQHWKPGGCCTSFERNGFNFDVGVHYLGSLREEGALYKVLEDLGLLDKIKFITTDTTDRIITPDKTVFIRRDKNKTKQELIANFPNEKNNINRFFDFILKNDFFSIISKTKKMSFKKLLDSFLKDYKLKAILSILLGNIGLPPSKASALASIILYKEYIFDGGYYPCGGAQVLPNILASRFKEYGGDLLLSKRVVKIVVKDNKIVGVKSENDEMFFSKVVISNADATLTFDTLLDCRTREKDLLRKLKLSPSAFIIYLGIQTELKNVPKHYTTWFFSTYNIEKCYSENLNLLKEPDPEYMLCTFSSLVDSSLAPKGKNSIRIFLGANFANKSLWESGKDVVYHKVIEKTDYLIPGIKRNIEISEIATPYTFYKYTSNAKGAIYGWAATVDQIDKNIFSSETTFKNLYLTGHWVTKGVGQSSVSLVALGGRNTAKLILRKKLL